MAQQPPFPRVSGVYQMTRQWSVSLPSEFFRRVEDKQLVLWKPGLTCWVSVWNARPDDTPQSMYQWRRADIAKSSISVFEEPDRPQPRFAYLLKEQSGEREAWAFYGFTFGTSGHILFSIYFDEERDLDVAKDIWRGVVESAPP
jgi:hypothetical protein